MVPHRPASFLVWDTCTIVTATVLYLYSSLHNSHVKTWSSVGWSWKVGLFSVDSALIEQRRGTSLLHFTTWRDRKVPFVNQGIASTRHCPELKWLVCAIIYTNVCTMMKLSKGTFLRMASPSEASHDSGLSVLWHWSRANFVNIKTAEMPLSSW